ncbi:tRNA (N(6)-L-threonylcarbamoyladenosine(37)-C(2))-methylthiotransferase MtaB [Candidatus Endoriftia persephone]|jgi:threonylcarbamoyladenosine tRNA methylthiotransferase MtaB|uniref:MiaB family protein, possibly involved in tRNA or rRNA modification n=3 Tax=Gammaproteobacteria TaxID=1236 RepID=G2FBP2_9GAMM|nr:tRNA (N(6)-L-threonylcarbamoyladenosine(37)-C(2))-methylthiotransferase MtaB [Candidatus Endoriftia persephone]EGV52671.1 MiaB family protein [endosymbiont of Riftia pachyptila (vent Ph05)]EGW55723.1 MiaB family protein, possibly involved in tRNA or rRNA modification [endosymbiont of Tevnia jerichonana (vent Tica)]USF86291.1 tRNA (N(6)-L-threonylcarbamoyladenosine(37)-C(2))-methylthiotransferase MtaB [Candidatus Endoriftia persephone]
MRVHLKTLGCRLNEAELESWSREFRGLGHSLTQDPEQADLLVVNTCAVTEEAVRKSRKLLGRAHRQNPEARLVVTGCYASLDPTASASADGVDLVVPNQDKEQLVQIVQRELDLNIMPQSVTEEESGGLLARGRQRAFIKVQDGCRYRCTFCIVTLARGEERSRPAEEVIAEINRLHSEGIQEVVLTGVHLGGYGSDIDSDLGQLIDRVLADSEIPRLRVGSLEPWDLPDNFWSRFDNPRFMPHLHLPLQSGSDSVLRRMARRCKSNEFRQLVEEGRQQVPDLNITSDIIVGFPGETEAEWQQSLSFVEQMGFGHLHIFAYSPRSGTKAAGRPNPVPREIKRQRSEQLHQLGEQMKREMLERQLGKQVPLLVEGDGSRGWFGYTPNYLRVEIEAPADAALQNRIIEVKLEAVSAEGERLLGKTKRPL